MKWFDNIRIRYKLFIVFGALTGIMICFSLFVVAHINNIGNNINELIDSHQARQIHVADAIEEYFKMRVANHSVANMLLVGEDFIDAVSGYLEHYDQSAALFIENLHGCRDKMLADPLLQESEKQYHLNIVNDIEQVYNVYVKITDTLMEAVGNNDKEEMIRIYRDAAPMGVELSAKLQELRDLVYFTTSQKALEATDGTYRAIQTILAIAIGLILISGVALLFTVRNIDRPITKLKNAIKEITGGNLAYPIRDERGDELGSLSNHIGAMVDKITEHNKLMTILDNLDSIRKKQEDLTERQTKELEFQKAKLQSIFDAIPDLVFVKDLDSRFIQCNKAIGEFFNRDSDELLGKNEMDGLGFPVEMFEQLLECERTVFNEGRKAVSEEKVHTPKGLRFLEVVRVPLKQDSSIIGLIGIVRDITVHKELEKKQEELAHWYKSILDATPLPITVTDADMNWTFVNKAVEVFLGARHEEMLGQPCSNWNSHICNTPECGIARAKRGEKRTFFTHAGSFYQVDAEILKTLDGEVAGFIEVVQDITKIKEMEEEALSASKAKSQFLANMSHEIRTPMNAIMGLIEIQLQSKTLPPDLIATLKMVYNSGDLLLNIINDILDLSKIEAGKLELSPAKYKIASLISDTATLNMMRTGGNPIVFELSVDENTPSDLFGDELRIKQILNNLLSNAFKYTKKGTVTLAVSAEAVAEKNESEVTLVFKVSDTGQGMTGEEVSRLFDEYSRFNMEANRATEGTGLGMSITRNLVHLMNGEIFVKSALNKGSEFTIYLPQMKAGSGVIGAKLADNLQKFQTANVGQVKMAQVLFEPMPYGSVLIVDDVETNLYVAKGLLSPYKLSVDTVISGFEALEKINAGKVYDIVFMDHMMPQMDGIETTQKMRALGYTGAVVALTANALAGSDEMFTQKGFDGFISKPIDVRQMNTVLGKFIRDRYPEEAKKFKPEKTARAETSELTPKLIQIFSRDAEKASFTLRETALSGDLKLFTTTAHAMKSALANIGEGETSQSALALENAGLRGDTDFIAANTEGFIKTLEALVNNLRPPETAERGGADIAEDTAYLAEQLQILKAACEGYDDAAAYTVLDHLKEKPWKPETAAALGEIRDALFLHSDFDAAAERAGMLLT